MRNVSIDAIEDSRSPVIAIGNVYADRLETPEHAHTRAQLLYPARGVVTVNTRQGAWVVPPERAVWIPANTRHAARMSGQVSMCSVYIRPRTAATAGLPPTCCVVEVSPLLRALLETSIDLPLEYRRGSRENRIMDLILDEVRAMRVLPLNAPIPRCRVLAKVCTALLDEPESDASIDALAAKLAMSRSSFTRHFRTETGMSFGRWMQQARFLYALRRIGAGEPITRVALDCGYASPSAFTAAFRKVLGTSPSQYFAAS